MTNAETTGKILSNEELAEAIERFKRTHPELAEAMRLFDLSNEQYQATLMALFGPRISWSNSTNDTVTHSL
jgi:predicted RNA-binding protein